MRGKYEKQLITVFFCIAALFMGVFIIAASFVLNSVLKNEYRKTVQQSVISENLLAEISISTVNSVITNLQQNASVSNWGAASTRTGYYYEAVQVRQGLSELQRTFSAIPFFPAVTRLEENCLVISSYGSSSKEEYFQEETTLSPEQAEYVFTYFSENTGELVLPVYNGDQSLEDLYYFIRKPYSRSSLIYMLRLPISSLLGKRNEGAFILYNSNGILAYSSSAPETVSRLDACYRHISGPDFAGAASLTLPISFEGQDIYVSGFRKSNWKIAYTRDGAPVGPSDIAAYISIPFVLLCALFYLLFRFISKWLYRPVRDVLDEVLPAGTAGTLDEFHVIRQKAATAKELAGRLQAVMQENASLISQRFFRELVLGLTTGENPPNDNFQQDERSYSVGLFEFQEEDGGTLSEDIFFSKNALLSCAQQYSNIITVTVSHRDCVLIIQTDTSHEARELILQIIGSYSAPHECKIALSGMVTGIQNIHACLKEARHILEYKYLFPAASIISSDEIKERSNDNYHYPLMTENRLIQGIAEGRAGALDLFDELIRENFSNRDLTPETLRSFIYSLLGTISRAFQELKTNPATLLSRDIDYEAYYGNWSSPNIIRSIREILIEILDAIRTRNSTSDNRTLELMRCYIFENYSRDVTLSDMAEALGISGKYAGCLFKKLSNDTFKNFLNHYRVEQAKKIIEEHPAVKIVDLSRMVGFNSSNAFIRVFGKYTGMTPGAYASLVHENHY